MVAKRKKKTAVKKPAPKRKPKPVPFPAPRPYNPDRGDKYRESQAAIMREKTAARQEIGPLPDVVDPVRRESCRLDLRLFCETYLKETFEWDWSPDHLAAIERLQSCALTGGRFAFAMPRGSGKSSLCEAGALWAILYGHRKYVFLIGAADEKAVQSLESIRTELETNEKLGEDFPEVCYPIAMLDGEPRRANGQTLNGERTRIKIGDDRLIFPSIPGSPSMGSRIRVDGITGSGVRGPKAKTVDGKTIRPDLALVDDPQTDDSAASLSQCRKRETIINRAVLGMAGPGKKIAVFVPCTVIAPNDLADRILDRDRNPVWQGQRTRMVISWPERQDLWDQYAELRREDQKAGDQHGTRAVQMYRENQEEMDRGGVVSWEERYGKDDPNEISAIQHAWNLRIDNGDAAFNAEYQNEPDPLDLGAIDELDADAICEKRNEAERGSLVPGVTRVAAFIDVGKKILFWCKIGVTEAFSGHVLDYGTFPKQNRPTYFRAVDARPSLADQWPSHNENARIHAGLQKVLEEVMKPCGNLPVDRCFIDSGKWPDVVQGAIRQSPYRPQLMASKGWGIGSGRSPMSEWTKDIVRKGDHWVLKNNPDGRLIIYDANHWKSFVAKALLTPPAGVGCLQLFGDKTTNHQLFADHLTSEYRTGSHRSKVGDQSEQELWSIRPEKRDNHWLDCLVGAYVAASYSGAAWSSAGAAGEAVRPKARRTPISLRELWEKKHSKAGAR